MNMSLMGKRCVSCVKLPDVPDVPSSGDAGTFLRFTLYRF